MAKSPIPNSKPFVKGDPRINRKGRPKDFDKLRALAQQIAHEPAVDVNGDPIIINGHVATATELVLRKWMESKDPRLVVAFIEYAYGKVPTRTEVTGANGGPVEHKDVSDVISKLLPEHTTE